MKKAGNSRTGNLFREMKRRPVLLRWLLSSAILVLIPVVFGIILSAYLLNNLAAKEVQIQRQVVEQYDTVLNGIYGSLMDNANTLIWDAKVRLTMRNGDTTMEDRLRIQEVNQDIVTYVSVNDAIESLYIFFPQKNSVLSQTVYLNLNAQTTIINGLDLRKEENQKLFQGIPYNVFRIIKNGNMRNLWYELSPSTVGEFRDQDAVILIGVDQNYLKRQMGGAPYDLFIVDRDGEYLPLTNHSFSDEQIRSFLSVEATDKIGKYLIYSSSENEYGMRLVSVEPVSVLPSALRQTIWVVVLYLLLCFTVSIVMSGWMANRNYRPVASLIERLEERGLLKSQDLSRENNEFIRIDESFSRVMAQERGTQERKWIQDNIGRVIGLLNYGEDSTPIENEDQYRYLVISYDVYGNADDADKEIDVEDKQLMWFVVHNVSREVFGEEHLLASGGIGDWFYNIIMQTGTNDLSKEDFKKRLEQIISFISEQFQVNIVANVSSSHTGIKHLPIAHNEAMLVNEYRNFIGTQDQIGYYSDLSLDDEARTTLENWNKLEQVQNMLKLHREKDAKRMLDEIVAASLKENRRRQETENSTSVELKNKEISDNAARLALKAKEMADEHFREQQLNVNSIAEEFGVNNSYLSRTFKQAYGMGLLDYINDIRLREAEILMEAGTSVKEAAERVGFGSSRPLIRCFRDKYNMTPGDYYKMIKIE